MIFIIGGIVDAVTDTVSSITDTFSNVFEPVASFLSDVTGLDIDPALLQQIVTGAATGGMSAVAQGAAEFGLDALGEEFGDATGLPVEDLIKSYNEMA